VDIVTREYQGGAVDFNRVALIEQNLVEQQDLQAQSHGDIALGLIQIYRALGGRLAADQPARHGADDDLGDVTESAATEASPESAPQDVSPETPPVLAAP